MTLKFYAVVVFLLTLSVPNLAIPGEDWDCGDWTCSINGAAWTHSEVHRYKIYLNEKNGACIDLLQELTSVGKTGFASMIVNSDIHFFQ